MELAKQAVQTLSMSAVTHYEMGDDKQFSINTRNDRPVIDEDKHTIVDQNSELSTNPEKLTSRVVVQVTIGVER